MSAPYIMQGAKMLDLIRAILSSIITESNELPTDSILTMFDNIKD